MTLISGITLFTILVVLAAAPSTSVALVVTRSATAGFIHGAATTAGIVAGDLVFIGLALAGMTTLAAATGTLFAISKIIAGVYLIWIGYNLVRSNSTICLESPSLNGSSFIVSFTSGFLITLGDIKAIFFYASLFPAFMDLHHISLQESITLVTLIIFTVAVVKLLYAFFAQTLVKKLRSKKRQQATKLTAGCIMIGTGSYMIVKV